MYEIKVVVEGVRRGLLMHKFSVEASADLEKQVKKTKRVAKSREEEAEEVAYRFSSKDKETQGQLFLPAEHFLASLVKAGTSLQIKGQGKKTYKDAFKGSLDIEPEYIGLTDSTDVPLTKYGIDSRPVRIRATQGRIVRHRPHLKPGWRAAFVIQVMDKGISLEVVQAALEEAGRSACVGDYRPRYGQFRIVSFEKVAEEKAA